MGTKLGLMFEVAEGGFLDIDVRIEGPDGKIVHSGERESNGEKINLRFGQLSNDIVKGSIARGHDT